MPPIHPDPSIRGKVLMPSLALSGGDFPSGRLAFQPDALMAEMLEALKGLNEALDAYWNVGPKERGTGGTIKAIEAAQQLSKAAITKAEGLSPSTVGGR